MTPRRTLRGLRNSLLGVSGIWALSLSSCASQGSDSDPQSSNACLETRAFFTQEVWPKVVGRKCITCHGPGGPAAERYSSLLLYPSSYPGFLDQNLAVLAELARTEYEDVSVLLQKPLGKLDHGGGVQLQPGSQEIELMTTLVESLRRSTPCEAAPEIRSPESLILASPTETFRRASLTLAGRLPTQAEMLRLTTEGEVGLPSLIEGLLGEPAFKDWLIVSFNDLFLTDRYLGDSTNSLRREDFPNVDLYLGETVEESEKRKFRRSVAREPLELIAYIVQNSRPFTEILTADYTVLNPYSAPIYNETAIRFDDPKDENELRPGRIRAVREAGLLPFPHAGILSSPMFLNRFPTTPTNRNRARARVILKKFLATEILRVADRPIDPTAAVAFANPTRDDPSCAGCHSVIDPIAGAFMAFSDTDQERLTDREWFKEMFLPGFEGESMQVTDYPQALPWMAQRIAADPRFALSVTINAYRALTGQEPLEYPSDGEGQAVAAWERQDEMLRSISAKFTAEGYNFKTVIRELLLSPELRAVNLSSSDTSDPSASFGAYGSARLATPESLARKLFAVFGFHWARSDRQPALTTTYNILFGGIDSDAVTERLEEPNGVMSAVMWRMANEVSCQAAAWDFLQPREQRRLFPNVEAMDTPDGASERIRENIRHLHARILGEELDALDPELDVTYALFLETWFEGTRKLEAQSVGKSLPWSCRGRWDRVTGAELPQERRLEEDKNYVIRSWMAVITYLLSDRRFLYE